MSYRRALAFLAPVFLFACGGAPKILQMGPMSPAYIDDSSVSPRLNSGNFERIMIVPPSGSAGVEFQENMAGIERSFIARGVTVISSAITSRVILEDRDRQQRESGLQLSEVERALVLAKESNADAVLQIGAWQWLDHESSDYARRYFILPRDALQFQEVDRATYEATMPGQLRWWFGASVLDFTGRLIDVQSGEVLASFKISVPTVNTHDMLSMSFDDEGTTLTESFDWQDDRRTQAANQRAISALFDRLASLISS